MNGFWKAVIEKGRICQWMGILIAGIVGIAGGTGGWLESQQIVQVVMAGIGLAGGVELMKILHGDET